MLVSDLVGFTDTSGGSGGYSFFPSYDFQLFDLPHFGELFANSFGASTKFSASMPTPYVDFSLNQLLAATQPNNPFPYQQRQVPVDMRLYDLLNFFQSANATLQPPQRRVQQQTKPLEIPSLTDLLNQQSDTQGSDAYRRAQREAERRGCSLQDLLTGNCTPAILSPTGRAQGKQGSTGKETASIDSSVGDDPTKSGKKAQSIADIFKLLPEGSGIFLIAVVVIILLLLFVKR